MKVFVWFQTAAEQPDLYNVRRSGRQRKEVERYVIQSDEEEKRKKGRRGGNRRKYACLQFSARILNITNQLKAKECQTHAVFEGAKARLKF